MDVKKAVKTAKEYVSEIFEEEDVKRIGLEEVVFDTVKHGWKVTIGFQRSLGIFSDQRIFKVVQIDDRTGQVVSMTHRTVAN